MAAERGCDSRLSFKSCCTLAFVSDDPTVLASLLVNTGNQVCIETDGMRCSLLTG